MNRNLRLVLAAVAVAVGVAAPARGQQLLGFTIAPTEGRPGDLVSGQVDTADVAEHCVTDVEGVQARFLEFGLVASGEFLERYPDGTRWRRGRGARAAPSRVRRRSSNRSPWRRLGGLRPTLRGTRRRRGARVFG